MEKIKNVPKYPNCQDLSGKTTLMENDLNGRRPKWKTTSMEDDLNGRRPQWKMNSIEDDLKEI